MNKNTVPGKARLRFFAFLGLLSASYLQYYFLDVLTEIESLPTLVVFVPVKVDPVRTS
jgi:hypothetical protein